jgi:hypothetical protein
VRSMRADEAGYGEKLHSAGCNSQSQHDVFTPTTAPTSVGRPGRRGHPAANNTPTAARGAHRNRAGDNTGMNATTIPLGRTSNHNHHHHRDPDSGPYRDEDVLLSLQLLAYLSKYPHARQAFYES